MAFMQHASKSQLLLKSMEKSPYLASLQRLSKLKPEFFKQISALSFPELMDLLQLIAHPNFFTVLEKLPAETTFDQLGQWVEEVPTELPKESQHAITNMLAYQTNHERLAEEKKQQLLNLRTTYHLSVDKFSAGLAKLKPVLKSEEPPPLPVETLNTQFVFSLKIALLLALTVAFIAYSIIFLSITAALFSLALAAWITIPLILNQFWAKNTENQNIIESVPYQEDLSFELRADVSNQFKKQEVFSIVTPRASASSSVTSSSHGFFNLKNDAPLDVTPTPDLTKSVLP